MGAGEGVAGVVVKGKDLDMAGEGGAGETALVAVVAVCVVVRIEDNDGIGACGDGDRLGAGGAWGDGAADEGRAEDGLGGAGLLVDLRDRGVIPRGGLPEDLDDSAAWDGALVGGGIEGVVGITAREGAFGGRVVSVLDRDV